MEKTKLAPFLLMSTIIFWHGIIDAQTLFFDDFENGLSKWVGKRANPSSAILVPDPLNSGRGNVLTFTKKVIEGDIFSKKLIRNRPANKPYILEFDYLGKPANAKKRGNGGYIGYSKNNNPGPGASNHRWVGGTQSGYSIYRGDQYQTISDNGRWTRYRVDLSATDFPDFVLMLEDYLHARGVAGDAYFDNIVLTDARGPSYFNLKTSRSGTGTGKISSVPAGINCGANCRNSFIAGKRISLSAIPDANSTFVRWNGACSTNQNPINLTMKANASCNAVFAKIERCESLPQANVGLRFSAKFPDKPGKYYIIPADAMPACLNLIESKTELIIHEFPNCSNY